MRFCQDNFISFVLLAALALTSSCAHSRKNSSHDSGTAQNARVRIAENPSETSSRKCLDFCGEISGYAAEFGHSELSKTLCSVATCETGKKCRAKIVSSTGKYVGPFQFSKSSWRHNCSALFGKLNLENCRQSSGMQDLRCSTVCAADMITHGKISSWPHCGKDLTL